ncbi:Uncharacterized conserved protein, DUF58 family, contains vWF domain [Variovorax sp. HW608]|uniref:DUF58 domain-containing protein n=1 Tax=Variovorax sp. HW608 TaxID=1034889 RepID=UPI0008200B34|nr:DUF58 domain-containing protein [Variovorax sp. HW608]SCK49908.1 Uncharacterized conserved protein, DUF58 family, contains vWF domain [Variovorax sp. HW608]
MNAPAPARKWVAHPFAQLRSRIDQWFLSRRAPSDTLELTQRNVYILPTRAGWMLAATLLLLLVASINYQLNLGYLLTFLLAGCVAVGMYVCHGTLRGLAMRLMLPEPQYAGSAAVFRIVLSNARRSTRYGIGFAVHRSGQWSWSDVPAQGSATVEVAFRPERRGLHAVPTLTAETRFPLGTFRVWSIWRPAAQVLVYPAPESNPPPLPEAEPLAGPSAAVAMRAHIAGEYDGVRAYRRGDSLKLVVWKRAAQAQAAGSDELVSRDTLQAQRSQLWLDAQHAGLADAEARLSRLCAWVLMADHLGVDYGLRAGGRTVQPSQGEAHKRQCLEALALC